MKGRRHGSSDQPPGRAARSGVYACITLQANASWL
jgi:hypothetical protein